MPPSTIPSTFNGIWFPGQRFGSFGRKRRCNGAVQRQRHDRQLGDTPLTPRDKVDNTSRSSLCHASSRAEVSRGRTPRRCGFAHWRNITAASTGANSHGRLPMDDQALPVLSSAWWTKFCGARGMNTFKLIRRALNEIRDAKPSANTGRIDPAKSTDYICRSSGIIPKSWSYSDGEK